MIGLLHLEMVVLMEKLFLLALVPPTPEDDLLVPKLLPTPRQ